MQLKIVLLPEPLGPIRPRISPSLTSKETFDTAVKASNILVRPVTVRRATEGASVVRGQAPRRKGVRPLAKPSEHFARLLARGLTPAVNGGRRRTTKSKKGN